MSSVDRPPARAADLPLEDGQRLDQATFHERYTAMPERTRAELIGGVVFLFPPILDAHGSTHSDITGWLFHYQRFTPGLRGSSNATVILGPDVEVQPDCQLLISEALGGRARVVDGYVNGPPELVVEVGDSSRTHDLGLKRDAYEMAGILEYLFVEIEPDEVRWFVRRNGLFQKLELGEDGIFRSEVFPGLWLDPKALFDEDRNGLIAALERGLASDGHAAFIAEMARRGALN